MVGGIQTDTTNMVKYISEGDIFKIEGVNNYAHGCNCAGAMGKGIALVFRAKYPQMYNKYKELCKNGGFTPGRVMAYPTGGGLSKSGVVFNLGTQSSWKTGARLEYIQDSLEVMVGMALDLKITKIAMPAIGAGLGGLKWDDVKAVIDKIAGRIPEERLTLFVVEKYSPVNS